jgi:hypothetical protein
MAVERVDGQNLINIPREYVGLSTDVKPTPVPPMSTFYAYDTKAIYIFASGEWRDA